MCNPQRVQIVPPVPDVDACLCECVEESLSGLHGQDWCFQERECRVQRQTGEFLAWRCEPCV